METESQETSETTLPNGSTHPAKRGRGRPRGSLNKKFKKYTEKTSSRPSKKVDFFAPETVLKSVKKRGRPKKIRIRGRPRKVPRTPEEESEILRRQTMQRKRKLWKPLGRPRIHPVVVSSKIKRGRGRPRKYEAVAGSPSQNATEGEEKEYQSSVESGADGVNDIPLKKRGRPLGSFKKRRGRPSSPNKVQIKKVSDGIPRKRGRPPGSGSKVKKVVVSGPPRKRGRPRGSTNKVKIIRLGADGSPRKRGRPPGSGKKINVVKKNVGDAPRKRGRPPGSGKIKLCVPDEVDLDLCNFVGTSAQRRKRGRPSKGRLAIVLEKLPSTFAEEEGEREEEEDKTEIEPPSPKRSRDSDSPVPDESPEDVTSKERDSEVSDEADDNVDGPKVNNISEQETEEDSRVGSGKFKKKK